MAISISTTPDAVNFTGLSIQFIVTSDRDTAGANTVTLADYSGTEAGTVKATTGSAHGYLTGDIVQITNTNNDGTYEITKIDADEFYFTKAYISGDDSGNCTRLNNNFQIKGIVTVGASAVATIRKFGVSGNYTFEIQDIIKAQMTPAPAALTSAKPVIDSGSIKTFSVHFYEEYDDVDGTIKTGDDTNSSTYTAVWGGRRYDETQSTAAYITAEGTTMPILSRLPALSGSSISLKMYGAKTDKFQFSTIVNKGSVSSVKARIITYNAANTLVATEDSAATTLSATYSKVVIPVTSSMWTDTAVSWLFVYLINGSSNAQVSEGMSIFFQDRPDHAVTLWWLNSLGGYDSYLFRGQHIKEVVSEKSYYKKKLSKGYSIGTRGRSVVDSVAWERHTVYSDPLSIDEASALIEAITSTDVYQLTSAGLLPVIVEDEGSEFYNSHEGVQLRVTYITSYDLT